MQERTFRISMAAVGWAMLATLGIAGGAPADEAATRAWVSDGGVSSAEVVTDDDQPPRFALLLMREMPTPGWTATVDSVEIDPGGDRIEARLTERPPAGIVSQVLTPARFEIPLGPLRPGAYFIEISTRRDPDARHVPSYALVVLAR